MKILSGKKCLITALIIFAASGLFAQTFTEQAGIVLPGISSGNAVWGDSDNDGDLDILIAGYSSDSYYPLLVKLYRNDGNNSFVDLGNIFSPAMPSHYYNYASTSVKWADFDNNGYLDILYNSINNTGGNIILVYKNEGNNTFTLKWSLDYLAVQSSSIDCGDYDNDGDLDFVLNSNTGIRLFQNQGTFAFTEQNPIASEGLSDGKIKFGDYDNDNDLDLIVSGYNSWTSYIKIYKNEGNNMFTLQSGTNLPNIYVNSTEWGDYNNDGKLDLLFAGYYNPVFRNEGNNTFANQYSIHSDPFNNGFGKWGDLDNDGDLDIVLSGDNYSTLIIKILIRNTDGTYSEASGITIDAVKESSVDLADYDNDGDLDILISGNKGATKITKVFKNVTSAVNAAPSVPTGLSVSNSGSDVILSWSAVSTDNTPANAISYNIMAGTTSGTIDLVSPHSSSTGFRKVSGMGNAQLGTSFMLRNLKKGTYFWKVQAVDNSSKGSVFSAESSFNYTYSYQAYKLTTPVIGAKEVTLSWSRGNGTNCIVFMKEANTGTAVPANNTTYAPSTVFKSGSQINTSGWYCVAKGNITSVNVTGLKAKTDYIFQVFEFDGTAGTEIYNLQSFPDNPATFRTGSFTEVKNANLLPVNSANPGIEQTSSSFWLDFDNDNDLDLLLTGMQATKLYRNDLNDAFFEMPLSFTAWSFGASCGDFNNDGWIDFITSSDPVHLYKNNGNNTFTDITTHGIPGTNYGSVSSGDYDNDGDLDVAITGETTLDGRITKVFKNNGNNTFTEQTSIVLHNVNGVRSIVKWGDWDNDGYLDVIVSGYDNSATFVTKVYRNNGNNGFQEVPGITLAAQFESYFDWGDYDNDGDLDLLLETSGANSLVYRNDGNSTFTKLTGLNLKALKNGSGIWGDYDSDGDLDILLCGTNDWYVPFTVIYRNDGNDLFVEDTNSLLPGAHSGSAAWGDYDNDGDLDFVLTGLNKTSAVSKIFRNDLNIVNNKPATPAGTAAQVKKSDVTLSWNPVKTDNTNYKALTYNVRVGTAAGTGNIVPPHASSTGFRRIASMGNGLLDTTFTLKKLPFGNYFWNVQAIDNGFAGGTPSVEGTFSIVPVQASNLSAKIISSTSLQLKWERGNGDRCVVFCKQTSSGTSVPVNNTTYAADSEFGFGTQVGSSGWYCVYNGRADSVTVTSLAGSKMYSFHIFEYTGNYGSEQYFTQVVDGNPGVFSTSLFTEQTSITITSAPFTNVPWGDYDNDSFIDFVVPGAPSRIYRNNGNNTFTEKTAIVLMNSLGGGAAWGDYDNDNDLDLLMTGGSSGFYPSADPATKLYKNNGADVFTEQTAVVLPQLHSSSAEWGDYDSDGDLDILLTGATGNDPNFNPVSKIFENNGDGTFAENTLVTLKGVYRGSGKWIDIDNDGDLDIVLIGSVKYESQWSTNGEIRFYLNNGDKTFTEHNQTQVQGYGNATTTWGDYDNDGDPDLIITSNGYVRLYENLGNADFKEHLALFLAWQNTCSAAWGDYDNDGYLDFILSNPGLDTKIYHNTHGKSIPGAISQWFNRQDDEALSSIGYGFINWVDYDNDGDLDFTVGKYGLPTKIFKNNMIMKSGAFAINKTAVKPDGLIALNTPAGVLLKWNPVKNDETGFRTMSYNIGIGTTKTKFDKLAAHSSSTGYRRIPLPGNAQLDTTHIIKNLPPQKFYWSVQAVDQSFKGGAWSQVDSFEVKNVLAFFSADTVCQGLNTSFTNQSVGFGETIQSYKWIFETNSTSAEKDPVYTFGSAGVKNVTLIVYSSTTSDTLVKQVLVKAKPLVDFSASVSCVGTETTLTNLTNTGGLTITSWSWDYGDGKGSTAMDPGTHGFLNAGDYDVILTASADNNCSESVTKTVTVAAYPVTSISATTPLSFCAGDSVALSVVTDPNFTYRWMTNGINITGGTTSRQVARVTGNYTVEIINLTGNCKITSAPAVVTVLNAPAAPLITYNNTGNSTTICQNDSILLNVTNTTGYTYQWKLNGGAIGTNSSSHYAKNSGDYTIVVANSNGCSVNSINKVTVTVNPLPIVGAISKEGKTKLCEGESLTLSITATAGYLYSWKDASGPITGSTSNSYIAARTGDYQLEVTNSFGCKVTTDPVPVEVGKMPVRPVIDKGGYTEGTCLKSTPIKLSVEDVIDGYTYRWYKNGAPVKTSSFIEGFPEFGYYYVEADLAGCKSHSDSLKINSESAPEKPVLIAKGPTIWYLSSSIINAADYKWYFNGQSIPDATGSTYVAYQNLGLYRVGISYDKQCYSFSDTVRIPKGITGIEDIDPFRDVKIYPNPTTGLFTIEMNNNVLGEINIDIFAQNGSKILNIKFDKSTEHFYSQIDLSGQSSGMYILNLTLDKFRAVRKVLVE